MVVKNTDFNQQWAKGKSEAEFVAEFKGVEVIGLSEAELSDTYYAVTGNKKPEVKAEPKADSKKN